MNIKKSEKPKTAEMFRINTRISRELNDWLDEESRNTGVPKTTMIYLALENFRREKEVMRQMANMNEIYTKLEKIEEQIKQD